MNHTILIKNTLDIDELYIDDDNIDDYAELYDIEDEEKELYIERWCIGSDFFDDIGLEEIKAEEVDPDTVEFIVYDIDNFALGEAYDYNDEWNQIVKDAIEEGDFDVYYGHNWKTPYLRH